jgi:hypothetical protein
MPKQPSKPKDKRGKTERSSLLGGQLPLESETVWFLLVSALDVFMTYLLLWREGFTEGNPIAAYFLNHWGIKGMVYYKFGMVAFVTVITQIIARTREDIATRLLQFATVVVGGVVIYSLMLYLRH